MKWIVWRLANGSKFYGQVEKGDFFKIGSSDSIKIYNPMASYTTARQPEIEGGSASMVVSIRPLLDLEDYDDNFQMFNTSHFISWQTVNVLKCIASLDNVVEELKKRKKELEDIEKTDNDEKEIKI